MYNKQSNTPYQSRQGVSFGLDENHSHNGNCVRICVQWSRIRESNPPSQLGKLLYYRCTNPAYRCIIAEPPEKSNLFLSEEGIPVEEIRRVCYI